MKSKCSFLSARTWLLGFTLRADHWLEVWGYTSLEPRQSLLAGLGISLIPAVHATPCETDSSAWHTFPMLEGRETENKGQTLSWATI